MGKCTGHETVVIPGFWLLESLSTSLEYFQFAADTAHSYSRSILHNTVSVNGGVRTLYVACTARLLHSR